MAVDRRGVGCMAGGIAISRAADRHPRLASPARAPLAQAGQDWGDLMGDEDIAALRDCGLSDEEIFHVILAAAARCLFSKTLDATGTAPDAAFATLSLALRDALTVGRPIDPAGQP